MMLGIMMEVRISKGKPRLESWAKECSDFWKKKNKEKHSL